MHTTLGQAGQPPQLLPQQQHLVSLVCVIRHKAELGVLKDAAGKLRETALDLQLAGRLQASTELRTIADILDDLKGTVVEAARWRFVAPLLTLDPEAPPTESRIAALINLRAPGCLPSAGAVVDKLMEVPA